LGRRAATTGNTRRWSSLHLGSAKARAGFALDAAQPCAAAGVSPRRRRHLLRSAAVFGSGGRSFIQCTRRRTVLVALQCVGVHPTVTELGLVPYAPPLSCVGACSGGLVSKSTVPPMGGVIYRTRLGRMAFAFTPYRCLRLHQLTAPSHLPGADGRGRRRRADGAAATQRACLLPAMRCRWQAPHSEWAIPPVL